MNERSTVTVRQLKNIKGLPLVRGVQFTGVGGNTMAMSTRWLTFVTLSTLFFAGCNCGDTGGMDAGPDGGGGGAPLTVSDDITTDTIWSVSAGDCDVVVDAVIAVKAHLTIAAGVKVCFGEETGLIVEKTGALTAIGTATNRIVLTGKSPTRGFWKGVAVLSTNAANALQFVDESFAGSTTAFCCAFFTNEDIKAGVVVGDNSQKATLTVANSTISNSATMGLFAFDGSRLPGFVSNSFSNNGGAPIALSLTAVNDLDGTTGFSGGAMPNGKNVARVLNFSKTTDPVTMRKLDVPYAMGEGSASQTFMVDGTLTVSAGARLEFEANSGLILGQTARLTTSGTGTDRVVLTGRSPIAGFWKGVGLLSLNNVLTSTDVTFAGNDDALCCGFFEPTPGGPSTSAGLVVGDYATSASATITDVKVTQSKNRGVSVLMGSLTQMGTNDLSTGNGKPNILP